MAPGGAPGPGTDSLPALPTVTRGPSTRGLLSLSWSYPVYAHEELSTGPTVAKARARALAYDEAFDFIAGDDPRPLLVLRECKVCNGTDDALLSRGADNEKTFLLSRWFHCVKLPPDVLDEDHALRKLFAASDPEHFFLSSRDGSLRVPLESQRSRTELWSSMLAVLAAEYVEDPSASVRQLQGLLDKLDRVDERILQLEDRVEVLLETAGPGANKLARARADLERARREREELLERVSRASELRLKRPDAPPAPTGEDAGGG